MSIEIRPLDRQDEAQVRRYWEVGRDAVAERRYNTYLAWEAARTLIPSDIPGRVRTATAAWDGDRMVGIAGGTGSTTDNLHRAAGDVWVHPDFQGRGVGALLLETLEAWCAEEGRRVLAGEVFAPVDDTSDSLTWAERHGFRVAIEDAMKVLDVGPTQDAWNGLAAEAAPHHADYTLRTAWSPLPDDLVEGCNAINNMFISEAPSGDADVEDEVWDERRLRDIEERAARAGRHDVRTFAIAPDGEVAAMTEAFVNEHSPARCFQGGTLVVPGHRGHRLGLAVKVANHQALVERFPELEWIVTGNADVNTHMNAINERLGFRVVERCLEVEKAL